jgi:hypothetical protein
MDYDIQCEEFYNEDHYYFDEEYNEELENE